MRSRHRTVAVEGAYDECELRPDVGFVHALPVALGGSLCCHLIQLKQERHPRQKKRTSEAELPVSD